MSQPPTHDEEVYRDDIPTTTIIVGAMIVLPSILVYLVLYQCRNGCVFRKIKKNSNNGDGFIPRLLYLIIVNLLLTWITAPIVTSIEIEMACTVALAVFTILTNLKDAMTFVMAYGIRKIVQGEVYNIVNKHFKKIFFFCLLYAMVWAAVMMTVAPITFFKEGGCDVHTIPNMIQQIVSSLIILFSYIILLYAYRKLIKIMRVSGESNTERKKQNAMTRRKVLLYLFFAFGLCRFLLNLSTFANFDFMKPRDDPWEISLSIIFVFLVFIQDMVLVVVVMYYHNMLPCVKFDAAASTTDSNSSDTQTVTGSSRTTTPRHGKQHSSSGV